jgi:hypothetical protein
MHEFHAWIGLSETPGDDDDRDALDRVVEELREIALDDGWHDAEFRLSNLNGSHFLTADGYVNRRREEGERLDLLVTLIARKLPGSWGLIYERDDEMPPPIGPNAFRVRVIARGQVTEHADPFLSPCRPTIED